MIDMEAKIERNERGIKYRMEMIAYYLTYEKGLLYNSLKGRSDDVECR